MGDCPEHSAGQQRRSCSGSQSGSVHNSGKRPRRGEWWSKELGVRVEISNDFIPDSQLEDDDEFIFFPDSSDEGNSFDDDATAVCGGDVGDTGRALSRGHEEVQQLRRLFPPIPSLTQNMRNWFASTGRKDDKLLLHCGIKPLTHPPPNFENRQDDDEVVIHEESQPTILTSSSTWSSSMFKSKTPYGPPSPPTVVVGMSSYGPPSPPAAAAGISSYGPPSPPAAAGGMSSYGPPSPPRAVVGISSYGPPSPAARTLRSRWPTSPCTAMAPAASVGMSPSSKSGGLLRSNLMDGSRRVKDQEKK